MASTLALGTSSYQLLEELGGQAQLTVKTTGSSTQIRATGTDISDLGINTTSKISAASGTYVGATQTGTEPTNFQTSSNINVFGSLNDFQANLGGSGDTLSIFGDINGSRISLDNTPTSGSVAGGDGSDLLSVSGSIGGSGDQFENEIWAGGGNDTIRIAGSIQNSTVFLGDGDDYFSAGEGTNVHVLGGDGNDYVQFRKSSEDTRINLGNGFDTVVLSGLEGSSYSGTAAVEMGGNNDSLVLGSGNYDNAQFNTGSGRDTVSIASNSYFTTSNFNLDGFSETGDLRFVGGDKLTSGQGNKFASTSFSSSNIGGDSLVFGNTTTFSEKSIISLGDGADSLVFGSNSTLIDSYILMGGGSDTLVFGAGTSFNNTIINLGGNTGLDMIQFNASTGTSLKGVTVIGANNGDFLYIGATSYGYSSTGYNNNNIAGFYNATTKFDFSA